MLKLPDGSAWSERSRIAPVQGADAATFIRVFVGWHCYDEASFKGESMELNSVWLVAALLAGAAAQAQTPARSPEVEAAHAAVHKACDADIKTLCGEKQGHEAMMCLRSTPDKVSAGCKDAMSKLPKPTAQAH
jgi:hypothetical protein